MNPDQENDTISLQQVFENSKNEIEDLKNVLDRLNNAGQIIIPPSKYLFRPFRYCSLDSIKVVIFGYQPSNNYFYRNGNRKLRYRGIPFSISVYDQINNELNEIFTELKNNIEGFKYPEHGNLRPWFEQGVLMMYSSFTSSTNNDDHGIIWHGLIRKLLNYINQLNSKCIYCLWGNRIVTSMKRILPPKSYILEFRNEPGRKFQNCDHFRAINEYLIKNKIEPINWNLPSKKEMIEMKKVRKINKLNS